MKTIKKKVGFNFESETIDKLDRMAEKLNLPKSKLIEIIIKKLELNTFKDDFDFYNLKISKGK